MKKLSLIIICIVLTQNIYSQNNQPQRTSIKAYFNDIEIEGYVYNNYTKQNIYENYSNFHVNLTNIFHLLGSEVLITENIIRINNQSLGNFTITYENTNNIIFNPRPYPFPSTDNSIIIVDNEYYIRLNLVRYLISGYTEENEGKVALYSRDYERLDLPVLNIKAFLNDTEIDGPVYNNIFGPRVQGINYFGSLVRLTNIFSLLGSEININGGLIEIFGENTGNIRINYINQNNIIINSSNIRQEFQGNNSIVILNNEYYIQISMVRYLINGALAQEENSVILYTRDYERLDIPLSLLDCYLALNDLLDIEIKEDIRNSSIRDLIKYHMSLGMWIRNNWLRQSNNRITGTLYSNGLRHLDDMSQIIIVGYHYYLNGITKTIEELKNEP
jgi:hypothetical protein